MELVNTHRTKEASPPESDEAAHFGRFSVPDVDLHYFTKISGEPFL